MPCLWVVFSSLAPSSGQSLCLLYLNPPHPASLKYHSSLPSSWHCGAVWFSWKSDWYWLPRFVLYPHVCPWWLYTQQVHISFSPASRQTAAGLSGQPACLPTTLDSRVFLSHLQLCLPPSVSPHRKFRTPQGDAVLGGSWSFSPGSHSHQGSPLGLPIAVDDGL